MASPFTCSDAMPIENECGTETRVDEKGWVADPIVLQFDRAASRFPDDIAVGFKEKRITYRELQRESNHIARFLLEKAGQGKIAFYVPVSEWYALLPLSIVRAGSSYIPIDPSQPIARVKEILDDCRPDLFITDRSLVPQGFEGFEVLFLEDIPTGGSDEPFFEHPGINDTFVILYTSGTTGRPKGVQLTHGNVSATNGWLSRNIGLGQGDVSAYYVSIGFGPHYNALFNPLISGAELLIIPSETRLDIPGLRRLFIDEGVTHSILPSSVCKRLLSDGSVGKLRCILAPGERLPDIHVDGVRIYCDYGQTESADIVISDISDKCSKDDLGRPLDIVDVSIRDADGRILPPGSVGEICVIGPTISLGYLDAADDASIVPAGRPDGYRLRRTGDLGRLLPNGHLELLGRKDSMVKIRGNRVEPAEVESCIRSFPGISDVTVLAITRADGSAELCAYVVSESHIEPSEVQSFVSGRKPEYMVPAFVIRLDSIPLNVNGKVDRRALPEPDPRSLLAEYAAPENDIERGICEAFSEALGIERIGLDDDFIRLGGDSLKAMSVQNSIGGTASTAAILLYRTPREIARHSHESSDLERHSIDEGCPLTVPQINIYNDMLSGADPLAYMLTIDLKIPDDVPTGSVDGCISKVIGSHPILSFVVKNGRLIRGPDVVISHKAIEVGTLGPEGPLCAVTVDDDRRRISMSVSHLISDATSIDILRTDLEGAFEHRYPEYEEGFLTSKPTPVGAVPRSKEFFDEMFADADSVPSLVPMPLSDSGRQIVFRVESDLSGFCRRKGISEGSLLTGALGYTLSRFTGGDKAVFCTMDNGRDISEHSHAVGMFVRTVPIVLDCSDQPVDRFLRASHDRIAGAMSSNALTMAEHLQRYGVRQDIVFQYSGGLFSFEDIPSGETELDYPLIRDISVYAQKREYGAEVRAVFSKEYAAISGSFSETFRSVLEGMMSSERLSDIGLPCKEIALKEAGHRYPTLIEAFDARLEDHAESILVSSGGERLTYREANGLILGLSKALQDAGVGKGDRVTVLVDKGVWTMLAPLAVMRAGAAYVPMDVDRPVDWVEHIISDSQSVAVIVDGSLSLSMDVPTIDVRTRFDGRPDRVDILPSDPAAVIYTSGSTGVPKGSILTHLGIENLLEWQADYVGLRDSDVFGMYPSFGFCSHIDPLLSCLMVGSSVDVIPESVRLDLDLLDGYVRSRHITLMKMAASIGRLFVPMTEGTDVRLIFLGGEKLGELRQPEWIKVVDGYGPTENTVQTSCSVVADKLLPESVGVPLPNVGAYILDREHRILPMGAVGELFVSGQQVSAGYVSGEEDAFFLNHFNHPEGYDRLYNTGDLARTLPDGSIGIIGRRDGQVKVRGNRVELTEVEACIRAYPGISDVSVQAIGSDNGSKELCAYVVSQDTVRVQEVQSFVSARKPDYMVPAFVIQLESVPLTVNGKVDRRALPEPDASSLRAVYSAPRSRAERILCEAFSRVLGLERIGIDDDFIRLGGESLKAIRAASICRSEGLSVTAKDMISGRTVRSIIESASAEEDRGSRVGPFEPAPMHSLFLRTLSKEQRDGSVQYRDLHLRVPISLDALERSLRILVDRHDALRVAVGNSAEIRPEGCECFTVSEVICEGRAALDQATGSAVGSISLDRGIIVACMLIHYEGSDYLRVIINRMAIDQASWGTILRDLDECIRSVAEGRDAALSPRTMPYGEWASRPYIPARGEEEFWSAMRGWHPLTEEPEPFSFRIERLDNRYGFESEDMILSALSYAFRSRTGEDIVVRMEGLGRDHAVERTVGWLSCQYPIRLQSTGDPLIDLFSTHSLRRSVPRSGRGYLHLYDGLPDVEFQYTGRDHPTSYSSFDQASLPAGDILCSSIGGKACVRVIETESGFIVTGRMPARFDLEHSMTDFISDAMRSMEGPVRCPLSGPAMHFYLDEVSSDRGTAYSVPGCVPVPEGAEPSAAIAAVISAYPVLSSRIELVNGVPYLVTDSPPSVESGPSEGFVRPFDMAKGLCRFRIAPGRIMWDAHHVIMDAGSRAVVASALTRALAGETLTQDLGFLKAVTEAPDADYLEDAYEYYSKEADSDAELPTPDGDGTMGSDSIRLGVSRNDVSALRTTAGVLFAAAFGYTLSRFSGSSRAAFPMTENGRIPGTEGSVGMFANTFMAYIDCSDASAEDFLNAASDSILAGMSHSGLPMTEVVRLHHVDMSVSFEYVPDSGSAAGLLGGSDSGPRQKDTFTDLLFVVSDSDDGYEAALHHSGNYSQGFCERFLRAFSSIVSGLIGGSRLSRIAYTSDEDLAIVDSINRAPVPLRYGDVLEAFRDRLQDSADSLLLTHREMSYSYSEVDRISDSVAAALAANGIGHGDRVGVFVPRSEWYLLCSLAILKTGAAYVPIDSSHPDDRVASILSMSGAKALLVTPETADRVSKLGDICAIDCTSVRDSDFMTVPVQPTDDALILFTSGTEGEPKGNVITRLAIESFCEWYVGFVSMTSEDRFSMYNSFAFGIHTQIFSPIIVGGSVDIVPDEIRFDIARLNEHFISSKVTLTSISTHMGVLFASSVDDSTVRSVLYGGEKLGEFTAPDFIGACNCYGSSENLAVSTAVMVNDRSDVSSTGIPISNVKAYILDAEHRRVPSGAVGELYISGYQLSKGYLNDHDGDVRSFFDNPFSTEPGFERMYATGDYFRILPDGTLGVVGRKDSQVKVRGNRVEVTEVESCIRAFPGVTDVTVRPLYSAGGSRELCAYVVSSERISAEDIRSFVSGRKPDYMVPAFVMQIDAIPLNVNGKVDRRALPKPDLSALTAAYAAPRSESEHLLCDVFAQVLGVQRIGIDDDFVRMGGDSLKAIRVASRCGSFGTALKVSDILSMRTVRRLSPLVSGSKIFDARYDLESGCPLTGGSLDVYLDIESGRSDSSYVLDTMYPLPEGISDEDVMGLVKDLLKVHPVLRSRVIIKDGEPWLSIDAVPEITVSDSYDERIRRPFVLGESLARFHIIRGRNIQVATHHVISDGSTSYLLAASFDSILSGIIPETDLGFLRDASSYANADIEGPLAFFRDMFSDMPEDTSLVGDPEGCSGAVSAKLTQSVGSISEFTHRLGIIPANLLAAAFGYTLSRFTGSTHAFFGNTINGRDVTGSHSSVGMFVRTVPTVIDCSDRSVQEFLQKSNELIFDTMSNQQCPFYILSKELDIDFGILFNHLTDYRKFGDKPTRELQDSDVIGDLTFNLIADGDVYILYCSHSSKFSDYTVRRMADCFDRIVSGMMSCSMLHEIQFTSADDLAMEEGINDTSVPLRYGDIIEAFRCGVSDHPDKTMLTYSDRSYSYTDVDRISDSIASALVSQGIVRGDAVAVMVPRSEWYLLCALGVLKTGAAYVPIDTSYPDERISFMLSDSSVKAVLVTADTDGRASSLSSSLALIRCEDVSNSQFIPPQVSPGDTAVILYTSGTTGTPKGSLITRLAIESLSEWSASNCSFDSDSVYALYTSCAFDMHTLSLYTPIISGGAVDIVPEDVRLDIRALNGHFISHGVTHTFITTNLGKMFASSVGSTSIRCLVYGGEKLGEFTAPDGIGALETYGPSENLAISTAIPVNRRSHSSSVGNLINNVKGYILDREHRRVPVGAVGELYLSGYQLSSGYLNNPERNAEAFFDNPFTDEKGYERMYATGDFFRLLQDGTLGIIGRRDGQVKIRGNRVELTEVESCIRTIPGISDVTVQPIVAENGSKELCAYIVMDSNRVTAEDVQLYVAERKPDYMVPAFVITLDSMPLNVNGKVDKRALPLPDVSSAVVEYMPPSNDQERIICEAFAEVLGLESVGANDDFIRLGGDSLKAIKVVSICNSHGLSVRATDILRHRLPIHIPFEEISADAVADTGKVQDRLPLTEAQLNIYLDVSKGMDRNISMPRLRKLPDGTDPQRGKDAIAKVLDSVRVFHTRIESYGVPFMVYTGEPIDVPLIESDGKDVVGALSPLLVPFDDDGPMARAAIVLSGPDVYLFINVSHLFYDGVSSDILFERFFECLDSGEAPKEDARYLMSRRDIPEDELAKAHRFFDDMLSGVDITYLPIEGERSGISGHSSRDLDLDTEALPEGYTPNMLITAAISYTISKFTGSDHSTFLMVDSGRSEEGSADSIGLYMRMIPVAVKDESDAGAYLSQVKGRMIDAMAFGYYPFRLLANEYGVDSKMLTVDFSAGDVSSDSLGRYDPRGTLGDLLIYITAQDGGYRISAVFDQGMYGKETIDSFLNTVSRFIRILCEEDDLDLSPYASEQDIGAVEGFNRLYAGYEYISPLDRFRRSVETRPEHTAIIYGDTRMSYRSLWDSCLAVSSCISGRIRHSSEGGYRCIAFQINPSEWYAILPISILMMGYAYVPVDPDLPDNRVQEILDDCDPDVFITTRAIRREWDSDTETLFIEDIRDADEGPGKGLEIQHPEPDGMLAILYTSGTTGKPKGVKISQDNISAANDWYSRNSHLDRDSVMAFYVSIGYAPHYDSLFAPLTMGASIVVVPGDIRLDMIGLRALFRQEGVTHAIIPSPVCRRLLSDGQMGKLAHVFAPGEKLSGLDVPGITVYCDYGQTECPNMVIHDILDRHSKDDIGFHTDLVSIRLLDEQRRDVPVGAIGEICATGPMVSPGYLHIDDGSIVLDGSSRYPIRYTGDLARYLSDGHLELLGRKDSMVKIRGNRVEPMEVDRCIRSIPGIRDVTVQPIAKADGSKELCAYVVSDNVIEPSDIQLFVSERKPEFMVPSFVIQVESIPLNVNGKVDKRALPLPDLSSLSVAYVAPRKESERLVCEAFSEALGIEMIGIDDDFVRLGGDSLKAICVSSKCGSEGLSITVADILSKRTPRIISQSVSDEHIRYDRYDLDTGCPLTGGALGVYLDIESGKTGSTYVNYSELPIDGLQDKDAIELVRRLLEVHPVLRSRVVVKDGEPWLLVDSDPEITISDSPIEDYGRPLAFSESLSRFHVVSGKFIQVCVHHIITDGPSFVALRHTVQSLIDGEHVPQDLGFLRDASLFTEGISEKHLGFFRRMFSDIPENIQPLGDADGSEGRFSMELSKSLTEISEGSSNLGTTPANLLLAAFGYMLSRFTGSSSVVVSNIVNGRDVSHSEGSVGMFSRTIPLAIGCGARSVKDFIEDTDKLIIGSISNQLCPFHVLSKELNLGFDVMFNHLTGVERFGKSIVVTELTESDIIGDLSFDLVVDRESDRYVLICMHSSKFSDATVRRMADSFDRIVTGLFSCSQLQDIQFTSEEDIAEEEKVNDTSVQLQYPDILDAFIHHVSESPDSTLLMGSSRSYTYSEADRISDSIAAKLTLEGISAGDNVAIMVPRSEWYLLCVLGILKTGAAYVPVDISYPNERIAFMLSDSSSSMVLVTPETHDRASGLCSATVVDCTAVPDSGFDRIQAHPDDTAVVLYTSGTTGNPKGSAISRLAILNHAEYYARLMRSDRDSCYAVHTSFGFVAHTATMFPPLISGSKLIILPESVRQDIDEIGSMVKDKGITHMFLTTRLGEMFASMFPDSILSYLIVGGEALSYVPRTSYTIIDGYGPTEYCDTISNIVVTDKKVPSSLGYPDPNTKVYILDADHRRVPFGAVGELYVSGFQISSGYLNNKERNEAVFLPNPFTDQLGYERMYATGDLFRFLPDGTLGIIGRRDGQVKIRGNRVELTEVEACVRAFPGISDATVQTVVREDGSKELCAYVVSQEPVSAADVQAFVESRKPDYMIPAFVMQMDAIPLNVNGKVDRRALPKPDLSSLSAVYASPRNESENILCDVFAQVLGVPRVGIDDDFIRLGGDSLRATKAASVFNGLSNDHILVRDILRKRTVRAMSSEMRSVCREDANYSLEAGHPSTLAQKDVIEYMEVSGLSLNIPTAIALGDQLDVQSIVSILNVLIATTPGLRMHVVKRDGEPYIMYDAAVEIKVDSCDPKEYATRFVRPYTPYDPCLSRFAAVEWQGSTYLFIDVCHLIFDGRSFAPMIARMIGILMGNVPQLDDGLLRQAVYDRSYMRTQVYRERVQGLLRRLEGSDDVYEDSEPLDTDSGFESLKVSIGSDDLAHMTEALDTGPSDVFYLAFAHAMGVVYGKDKLFYIIEDGRGDVDVSESVGLFMRLHPIWIRKHGTDALGYAREAIPQIDETMSYSDVPITDVRRFRHIYPDVVIQFNNYLSNFNIPPGFEMIPLRPISRSPFRIHVNINPVEGGFVITATHDEHQSGEPVRGILKEFDSFLLELKESIEKEESKKE